MPKNVACNLPASLACLTAKVQESVEILNKLIENPQGQPEILVASLKQLRIDGKQRAIRVAEELGRNGATGPDNEYIADLCRHLDDVLDIAESTSLEIVCRREDSAVHLAGEVCKVLLRQVREIAVALVNLQDDAQVIERCTEVYRLQAIAGRLLQSEVKGGWEGRKDFVDFMTYRKLIDQLERATDKAERIAELVHSMLLRSA